MKIKKIFFKRKIYAQSTVLSSLLFCSFFLIGYIILNIAIRYRNDLLDMNRVYLTLKTQLHPLNNITNLLLSNTSNIYEIISLTTCSSSSSSTRDSEFTKKFKKFDLMFECTNDIRSITNCEGLFMKNLLRLQIVQTISYLKLYYKNLDIFYFSNQELNKFINKKKFPFSKINIDYILFCHDLEDINYIWIIDTHNEKLYGFYDYVLFIKYVDKMLVKFNEFLSDFFFNLKKKKTNLMLGECINPIIEHRFIGFNQIIIIEMLFNDYKLSEIGKNTFYHDRYNQLLKYRYHYYPWLKTEGNLYI